MKRLGKAITRIFKQLDKVQATLKKPILSDTEGTYGGEVTFAEFTIEVLALPSLTRELFYRMQGTLEEGTLRVFAYPEYDIKGTKVTVSTGDKIRILDIEGEILAVYDYILPKEGIVLKECVVR